MLDQLTNFGVIRMGVTFGVLFRFPEAERQDAVCIRHEDDLIHKASLRLQRGQHFVMQRATNLFGFSGFRLDFDNANKHGRISYPLSYEDRKPPVNGNGWERTTGDYRQWTVLLARENGTRRSCP